MTQQQDFGSEREEREGGGSSRCGVVNENPFIRKKREGGGETSSCSCHSITLWMILGRFAYFDPSPSPFHSSCFDSSPSLDVLIRVLRCFDSSPGTQGKTLGVSRTNRPWSHGLTVRCGGNHQVRSVGPVSFFARAGRADPLRVRSAAAPLAR